MDTEIKTPPVAVIIVIFTVKNNELQVLLIHRSDEPAKDSWSLPGGLLVHPELLDTAATRKLQEESGLSDVFLEQLYTFTNLDDKGTIAVSYFALVDSNQAILANRKAWLPAWHSVGSIDNLSFKNESVVNYALQRLRTKMNYSNVSYSLLPQEFTLSQLQKVYEAIAGHTLDKRNFRKRMLSLGIIEGTGRTANDGAHRPAQLYTFREHRPIIL